MARPRASEPRIRAGIELAGHTLRYAEVDLGPRQRDLDTLAAAPGPRLVRLGACDFEFDVAGAILDPAGPTHLETVATAIGEIFSGSTADRLCVAVHAWHATSFFSPLPAGMPATDRFEQLRQEAAMLSGARLARPVRVSATPLRLETRPDGSEYHWHHVLRLPEAVHARMAHVSRRLGEGADHAFVDASGAAGRVAVGLRPEREHTVEIENPADVPFVMAVGVYGDRFETAICRGSVWHFSHWAEAPAPADATYFSAALLDRLGIEPRAVQRLYAYGDLGDGATVAALETLLATEAQPLDPLRLFRLVRSQADPQALSAFAPCVGAALAGA
jgi:hypothetical protein